VPQIFRAGAGADRVPRNRSKIFPKAVGVEGLEFSLKIFFFEVIGGHRGTLRSTRTGEGPARVGIGPLPSRRTKRLSPVFCDPVSLDPNRRCTRSHHLRRDGREASKDEPGEHVAPEAVSEHQRLRDAARGADKQSQCAALVGCQSHLGGFQFGRDPLHRADANAKLGSDLRMPRSPFVSAARIAASTAPSIFGRPDGLPLLVPCLRARTSPAITRSRIKLRSDPMMGGSLIGPARPEPSSAWG
jgi:hypothetical protein